MGSIFIFIIIIMTKALEFL